MDEKNLGIILDAVAEKIKNLKLDISLKNHDIKRLEEDNERLKEELDSMERQILELHKIIEKLEAKNGKKD